MGMFNNVTCLYKLPDLEVQDEVFQTKSLFENVMDDYTITASGTIIWHRKEYEETPEEERPNWGTPEWDSPLGPFIGSMRICEEEDVKMDFTGSFNFYTHVVDDTTLSGIEMGGKTFQVMNEDTVVEWYEYKVDFFHGKLINLQKVDKNF